MSQRVGVAADEARDVAPSQCGGSQLSKAQYAVELSSPVVRRSAAGAGDLSAVARRHLVWGNWRASPPFTFLPESIDRLRI